VRARFFIMSLDIRKKSIERSMSQKNAGKYEKSGHMSFFVLKAKLNFKKGGSVCLQFSTLFQTKKNIWLYVAFWLSNLGNTVSHRAKKTCVVDCYMSSQSTRYGAEIFSDARVTHSQYALKISALYSVLGWRSCFDKVRKRNR
jgi:hypothetical protein